MSYLGHSIQARRSAVRAYIAGKSSGDAGRPFGVASQTVVYWLKCEEVPRRKRTEPASTEAKREAVRRMLGHASEREIARTLGVSRLLVRAVRVGVSCSQVRRRR